MSMPVDADRIVAELKRLGCTLLIIRAMDTAVALGVDIGSAVQRKAEYNKTRPYRNGGKIA